MRASSILTPGSDRFGRASLILLMICSLLFYPISVSSQEFISNTTDTQYARLASRAKVTVPASFQSFPWVHEEVTREAQYVAETKVIPGIQKSIADPQPLQIDMDGFLRDYEIMDEGFKELSDIGNQLKPEDYAHIGASATEEFRQLKVCSKLKPKAKAKLCYQGSFSRDGKIVILEALFKEQDSEDAPPRRAGCIFCYLHVYAYYKRTEEKLPTLNEQHFSTSLSLVEKIYSDDVSDDRFAHIGKDLAARLPRNERNDYRRNWNNYAKGAEEFTALTGTFNGMVYGSFIVASQKAKKRDISNIHAKFTPGMMVANFESASGSPTTAQPDPQQPDCGSSSKDKGKRALKGKQSKGTGSHSDSCPVGGGKTAKSSKGKTTKPKKGKTTKPAKGKVTKPKGKTGKTGKTAKPKKTAAGKSKAQH